MLLFLSLNLNMNIRVRIIALHHANCEVNSSCCDCKVVDYTKIAKQFFSQGKFNSSKLYFSESYPYFIHLLHTIIKRNIAYTENYTTKWKKCFAIFKKHFRLYQGKNLATLGILLQSEFRMIMGTLNVRDMVTFSAWYPRKGHTYLNLQLKDT